jgi:hypothetical protein
MEKKIRKELYMMSAIMAVLIGLGIYAHEFVIDGIMAKAALNLSIFALFFIAAGIAFSNVTSLKNEVVALKALQVDFGVRSRRPLDPYKSPAIVFQEPKLLGAGYRMITEELGKQDSLQISNTDAQHLLHDVDLRIADRKSTILYFAGLMVFLGLLGAFMGLMKTVAAVSDLIGAMDLSGNGGTDSIARMIEGMKAPLNGMSVGFSSSLFGLMTSMVLGALERNMTSAMKSLRHEFEHWLSHVSALEAANTEAGHRGGAGAVAGAVVRAPAVESSPETAMSEVNEVVQALALSARQLEGMRHFVAQGNSKIDGTQLALMEMSSAITQLTKTVEQVDKKEDFTKSITACFEELAHNQNVMVGQFHGLISAAKEDRAAIRSVVERMGLANSSKAMTMSDTAMQAKLDAIAQQQEELLERRADAVASGATAAHVVRRHSGLLGRIRAIFNARSLIIEAPERLREQRRLRSDVREMIATQREIGHLIGDKIGGAITAMELERARDSRIVRQIADQSEKSQARLEVLMTRFQTIDEALTGTPDDPRIASGLHGARFEMNVLARRLDAQEDAYEEPGTPSAAPHNDEAELQRLAEQALRAGRAG